MEYCGHITREYTMWCGHWDCAEWVQESGYTLQAFKKMMRRRGWKLTKKYRWICPACVARLKEEKRNGKEG